MLFGGKINSENGSKKEIVIISSFMGMQWRRMKKIIKHLVSEDEVLFREGFHARYILNNTINFSNHYAKG